MPDFHYDQAEGLRRIMAGPRPRIVSVLSASSTNELPRILTNLAASLARDGSDTLIVHAAGTDPDALKHYGLQDIPALSEIARKRRPLMLAVGRSEIGFSASSLLAHGQTSVISEELAEQLGKLINELAVAHEIVIVEAALNQQQMLPLAMLNEGEIVIQLTRKPASIKQAYSLIKQLYSTLGKRPFGILVNSANEKEAQTVFCNIAAVARQYLHLDLEYMGHIPVDEHVSRAIKLGRSVIDAFPSALASLAFRKLARRLNDKSSLSTGLESGSLI